MRIESHTHWTLNTLNTEYWIPNIVRVVAAAATAATLYIQRSIYLKFNTQQTTHNRRQSKPLTNFCRFFHCLPVSMVCCFMLFSLPLRHRCTIDRLRGFSHLPCFRITYAVRLCVFAVRLFLYRFGASVLRFYFHCMQQEQEQRFRFEKGTKQPIITDTEPTLDTLAQHNSYQAYIR